MINFKQYLEEARGPSLYHGTSAMKLFNILTSRVLQPGFADKEGHWPSKDGRVVSLTRSYDFAKNWAKDYSGETNWSVLEFNRLKLSNNYRIVPFNYFDDQTRRIHSNRNQYGIDMNQYEEVVTKPIINPVKYIDQVYLPTRLDNRIQRLYGDDVWSEIENKVTFTDSRVR